MGVKRVWPACAQTYAAHFAGEGGRPHISSGGRPAPDAPHLLGTTQEIEELRPKSPPGG
jgi:hypothetical protein